MSSAASQPFSMASELKALKHEKRNQNLARLPPNVTIQRRPLNHAPIADLRTSGARAKAPKVVYVSSRTPVVAAVKRVKKYLVHIERRALQDAAGAGSVTTHKPHGGGGPAQAIARANEALARDKEEVLVKASGRAMAQALRVGEWFRNKEKDVLCHVEVRAGNVSTVDDIVEVEADLERNGDGPEGGHEGHGEESDNVDEGPHEEAETSKLPCGDTTLDLLGGVDVATMSSGEKKSQSSTDGAPLGTLAEQSVAGTGVDDSSPKQSRRKRSKRKRPMYEAEDLPEARIRWIKTVEVAISLQT